MANPSAQPGNAIEQLLQERAQFEQWLARLDTAGNKAPEAVRDRVRADYRKRLEAVIDELRTHSATIGEELERYRTSQREMEAEQAEANERLAEAEVRYVVGEYADEEWDRIREEAGRSLSTINETLAQVTSEIGRLAEVQRLIAKGPDAPAPQPSAPEVRPPEPQPARAEPAQSDEGLILAELVVEETVEAEPPQEAEAEDELAFLKSVTEDEGRQPSPPPPIEPPAAPGAGAQPATAAKTLKCGECGTLNRPTEWYCERCGAELAAL